MKISQIISHITDSYETINLNSEADITGFTSIFKSEPNTLTFIDDKREDTLELINVTKSNFIICSKKIIGTKTDKCLIFVENPKYTFSIIVNEITKNNEIPGIHPTAIIHPKAEIDKTAFIGPYCVIGQSKIGENAHLHSNITIYDNVQIGSNCKIKAGSIIGGNGFGFIKNEQNETLNFPHIGKVILHENVEIGSNVSIDRGTLTNTEINANVKIDNNVHIAHNVVVGKNTYIIAQSMIGGSVIIGENCWISPGVLIRDQLRIGDNSILGMGAVVTKNVPANETWVGNPAIEISLVKNDKNK